MDKDLKNKTPGELEQIMRELGQKGYLARYIFGFIHSKGAGEISQISSLSKVFREELVRRGYYISQLKVCGRQEDADGTIKYLFELSDGNRIEAVLLFDDKRRTLCVSTQAGCAMGCTFCATARMGFRRNLTAGEIVDQVNIVSGGECRISNVVFMGMGEPLNNYEQVLRAVRILNNSEGRNIGVRHMTISSCGLPAEIERLGGEDIQPRLAISLNAPTDALRSEIMPINNKWPVASVMKAVELYQIKTGLRVTFEYVLLKNFNDGVEEAEALVKLLRRVKCNVNLIEFNPHEGCKFAASNKEVMERFAGILRDAGIETTIRLKMGQGIKAGCGQLGASLRDN